MKVEIIVQGNKVQDLVIEKPEPKMDIRTAEQKATGKRRLESELTKGKVPTIYR